MTDPASWDRCAWLPNLPAAFTSGGDGGSGGDDGSGARPTRRAVLRAGAGTLAGSGLASSADAAAGTRNDGGSDITTTAAINASAPSFGQDDYVGLFVQVVGEAGGAETAGVRTCPFLGVDEAPVAFDVQLLHLTGEDERQSGGVVLVTAATATVSPGQLYVINGQESCGDFYQLRLERVGASKIRAVEGEGGAGSSGVAPGFGALAALAGLGLGALGRAFGADGPS